MLAHHHTELLVTQCSRDDGDLGGLSPPKHSSKPPTLSMKHDKSVKFLLIFRMSSSPPIQVQPVKLKGLFQYYLVVKSHNGFATVREIKVCFTQHCCDKTMASVTW